MTRHAGSRGEWRVSQSIALELDTATFYVHAAPAALPRSLIDLVAPIPPTWIAEFDALCEITGTNPREAPIFEFLGRWARVLEADDYDVASAAMRETSADDALRQVVEDSRLEPAAGLDPIEALIDLEARIAADLWPKYGFHGPSDLTIVEHQRQMPRMATLCLRGGSLHGRFWHWMDRFYYEVYRPWRESRVDQIAAFERIAIEGLGGRHGTYPPELGWLPPDNMLVVIPTLAAAAESGLIDVVFWAEPFGIGSGVAVASGLFLTSFVTDGVDLEFHEAVCSDLAARMKVLADPTRLSMLRVVRNMDFDNTQLGGFLEVSRPTISVHAKVLAGAGFISTRREGRQARHTCHPAEIRKLCEDLLRFLDVPEDEADG